MSFVVLTSFTILDLIGRTIIGMEEKICPQGYYIIRKNSTVYDGFTLNPFDVGCVKTDNLVKEA